MNFIHLDGQVKKKETYIDDLYYPRISKDSLEKRNSLEGLTINQLNLYKTIAVNMKNTGMVLTILGGGAAIGGLYFRFQESFKFITLSVFNQNPDDSALKLSMLVFLGGCAATMAGIPLWITGSKRKYNADIAIIMLNTKPNNPGAVGLGLTVKF